MATASSARPTTETHAGNLATRLLAWYDAHHRDLPWRTAPVELARGVRPQPYHVWLSEIMLQQTTVEAVKPYFSGFLAKWPDVQSLAAAPVEDIMRAWAGLGYYSRARNLKACANLVATLPGGFPDTEEGLRALPGIGTYTAAAIAAIAFDRPAAVVDGNVERVTARLFDIRTPLPDAKREIRARVETLVPRNRPGDFAQAMMDLGATICTPKRPRCMLCPLRGDCRALVSGDPELLPLRAPKAERPKRTGVAYVATTADGAILMRTRPEKGLLGGMTEVPTAGWSEGRGDTSDPRPPLHASWRRVGAVSHVFTHFSLDLEVLRADLAAAGPLPGHRWVPAHDVPGEALPSVMKKAIEAAIPGATRRRKG
jgi:A/G-specific adenine glycosylase